MAFKEGSAFFPDGTEGASLGALQLTQWPPPPSHTWCRPGSIFVVGTETWTVLGKTLNLSGDGM